MAKHMLRVLDRKLHSKGVSYVSMKCERCTKNFVLPREDIYRVLVERSPLLVHTTPEGRRLVKEWSQCQGS